MRPIHDAQRRRLLILSATLCAVPIVLSPLAGRSSFEIPDERVAFDERVSVPSVAPARYPGPVTITRDPFVPDAPPVQTAPLALLVPPPSGVVGMPVVQGQPIGFALPPNRGAGGSPLEDASFGAPVVRAIVRGASTRALVEDGTGSHVVGIGDVVAGSPVVWIGSSAIRLKNGSILSLTQVRP